MLVPVHATESFDPSSLPVKRVGSGVLIRNADGAVLLVKPSYKEGWDIPGGLVEVGESPREAAGRECLEELGREVEIGDLLCVHYAEGAQMPGDGIMFVFDGGTCSASPDDYRLPANELCAASFTSPAELDSRLPPVMFVRLLAAIEATRTRAIVYLER
jgi:8-oxo-dGTP pyrophosphatase MutT (NUDIX family)